MSKNKTVAEETVVANPQGKTVEELKEVAQTLQTQMNQEQILLREAQATVQNHQAKILKMQGALEVMLQLIPKQEVEEMIAKEEEANNSSNGEVVEG
jgi:hypothetical protein